MTGKEFSYYGVSGDPFCKGNNGRRAFSSTDHAEAVGMMGRAAGQGGIAVITAAPGMGKSYALNCFSRGLDPKRYELHYICLSTVTVTEFYRQLSNSFGLDVRYGKAAMFIAIKERITALYKNHLLTVIIIDEAQDLNTQILKEIKSLMNFKMDTEECMLLILSGEPSLNITLQKPVYESLLQRVRNHYHFKGLSVSEASEYVKFKITAAGGSSSILTDDAYDAIVSLGKGNPRTIDALMTDAMLLGFQLKRERIDGELITAAYEGRKLG